MFTMKSGEQPATSTAAAKEEKHDSPADLFVDLGSKSIHLVGIKGTGMEPMAEYLHGHGATVFGSDVAEIFYTDEILRRLGIPYAEGFAASNLGKDVDFVVYSAVYDPETHPELVEARRRGLPLMEYTQALGAISASRDATGISGVHGKTTTTAMVGSILKNTDLPASIIVGSAVAGFGGNSVQVRGSAYLVAETCEYKRHFLRFHPDRLVITSVEPDHLDYYTGMEDILDAFVAYIHRLPPGGTCLYCADDAGASEAVRRAVSGRPDIRLVPYGLSAPGMFGITDVRQSDGVTRFRLRGVDGELELRIPGRHSVLNAAAAAGVFCEICRAERGSFGAEDVRALREGLRGFSGCRRRSELVGTAGGVVVLDDYAHHPTAIRTTLEGFREFYPRRRIVVSFMSHTYSRTGALLEDFARSFSCADVLLLHKIYASARETTGSVTGRDLFARVQQLVEQDLQLKQETRTGPSRVLYFQEPLDALEFCAEECSAGDLFLTMGAGNNWELGLALLRRLAGSNDGESR